MMEASRQKQFHKPPKWLQEADWLNVIMPDFTCTADSNGKLKQYICTWSVEETTVYEGRTDNPSARLDRHLNAVRKFSRAREKDGHYTGSLPDLVEYLYDSRVAGKAIRFEVAEWTPNGRASPTGRSSGART
jgi:hypothetical protein